MKQVDCKRYAAGMEGGRQSYAGATASRRGPGRPATTRFPLESHEDPEDQDAFYGAVTAAAFDRFTHGLSDGTALLSGLADATDEGRVVVHSFDPELQARFAGTRIVNDKTDYHSSLDPAGAHPMRAWRG